MVIILLLGLGGCAAKKKGAALDDARGWTNLDNNLHKIDGPAPGQPKQAYRLYRSGAPTKETFAKWCSEYGIERVIVMSGDADSHELKYQAEGICKNIQVIYDVKQEVGDPVSDGFLKWFDEQAQKAKQDNVGLLFRCQTGSHRTGRLAAYYQIKNQNLSVDQAIKVMNHKGMLMPLFDVELVPQVRAIGDYLKGQPCKQPEKACVEMNSRKYLP
jgi:hypothetical protein